MGKFSMDNPDPQRHRPKGFDWRWDGCGTSVEVGFGRQLTVVPLGDWQRLVAALGPAGQSLAERVRAGSEGLRRCVGCGGGDVVRYRSESGKRPAGYCCGCWEKTMGERLGPGADQGWSVGAVATPAADSRGAGR